MRRRGVSRAAHCSTVADAGLALEVLGRNARVFSSLYRDPGGLPGHGAVASIPPLLTLLPG